MSNFIDIEGEVFSEITVGSYSHNDGRNSFFECKCSCGNRVFGRSDRLRRSEMKSCGCMKYALNTLTSDTLLEWSKLYPCISKWLRLQRLLYDSGS